MLFIDLRKDEKEPLIIVTPCGERLEIRHSGRGSNIIGLKISPSKKIGVFGPHMVRRGFPDNAKEKKQDEENDSLH